MVICPATEKPVVIFLVQHFIPHVVMSVGLVIAVVISKRDELLGKVWKHMWVEISNSTPADVSQYDSVYSYVIIQH